MSGGEASAADEYKLRGVGMLNSKKLWFGLAVAGLIATAALNAAAFPQMVDRRPSSYTLPGESTWTSVIGGEARTLYKTDERIYLGAGYQVLAFDASEADLQNPVYRSEPLSHPAVDIEVAGERAYVALADGSLVVLELEEEGQPARLVRPAPNGRDPSGPAPEIKIVFDEDLLLLTFNGTLYSVPPGDFPSAADSLVLMNIGSLNLPPDPGGVRSLELQKPWALYRAVLEGFTGRPE